MICKSSMRILYIMKLLNHAFRALLLNKKKNLLKPIRS